MNRYGFALLVMYALVMGAASWGIGQLFDPAAQLIFLPIVFVGGIVLGTWIGRTAA